MLASAYILGFHGCDQAVAERILAGTDHVFVSENSHDWLGSGAYFWENDPMRAMRWAELVHKNPQHFGQKIEQPFVIGAIIEPGLCLDLGQTRCLTEIRLAHRQMNAMMEGIQTAMPVNEPGFSGDLDLVKRHLDCAVINFTHTLREDQGQPAYDTVRGAFPEGRPLYEGARIMEHTHVQICVRHPRRNIRGYFRPLTPG